MSIHYLGYVNFTKVIFDKLTLETNRNLVSGEVRKLRENNGTLCSLRVSPFQYSALFALRQSPVDMMTF